MPQSNTDLMATAAGLFAVASFTMVSWMPAWMLFSVLIVAGALYGSNFMSVGFIGTLSMSFFTFFNWFPSWVFFSAIVLIALYLAVKVATGYTNTGATGQ